MLDIGAALSGQAWGWGTNILEEWMSARAIVCALATLGASAALRCCAGVEAHARRARVRDAVRRDAARRPSHGYPQVLRGFGGSLDGRGEAIDAALFSNLDASFLAAQRDGGDSTPRSPAKSSALTLSTSLLSGAAVGGGAAGGSGSSDGTPRYGRAASESINALSASADGEGGCEGADGTADGTAAAPCGARAVRAKCCDALVALLRCVRCGRGFYLPLHFK